MVTIAGYTITRQPVVLKSDYDRLEAQYLALKSQMDASQAVAGTLEYTGRVLQLTSVYSEARKYSGTVYSMDHEYNEPKLSTLKGLLNRTGIYKQTYAQNSNDCENFAFKAFVAVQSYFKNVPFGNASILYNDTGKGHMLNCCFIEGKWYWYEPQTNIFMTSLGNNITVRYIQI